MSLIVRNARVLTLCGPTATPGRRRGAALGELGVLPRADVVVEGDRIAEIRAPELGSARSASGGTDLAQSSKVGGTNEIDAAGRVLMPGFVDCHTHACFAGDRLEEWDMKRQGVPYLGILRGGGGIMSTVRATRAAGEAELGELLRSRLAAMLRAGTTTVEVKSGYGLSAEHELAMLRAIRGTDLAQGGKVGGTGEGTGVTVIPTALLGHAIDPDIPAGEFVRGTVEGTLPAVGREFPGITVDAYCETGAWSVADCVRLLERAKSLGHPLRIHADQFNSLGMVREAVRLGARSVDHLEASTPDDLRALAASDTFGVILPCCGFHLDGRYADVRAFIDSGGLLGLATNYNPGSAPCFSMPMAIALAVRHCRLSPPEAIAAATINAAAVLGLHDRGYIAPGARADLILLHHTDERMLAYEFGGNPVDLVIAGGQVVQSPTGTWFR